MNAIKIAFALLAVCAVERAAAQPLEPARVARMAATCEALMARGLCGVENSAPIPVARRSDRWHLGRRFGVVTAGDYADVKSAGKDMCKRIPEFCADAGSAHCRLVRSQFAEE